MNQSGLISLTNTVFILALLLGSGTLQAQEKSAKKHSQNAKPEKGPAYVSPPKDDANYPLMGEFVGQLTTPNGKQKLALQIRPIAADRFVAIAFYGGLPGQPQHESEELNLIGLRGTDSLILSGGPWAIFVDPKGCTLVSQQGKRIGRLKRVRRVSPTLGAQPPEGATVIFDGKNTDNLLNAKLTPNGLLEQGVTVLPMFQDFNLHIEFRLPYMPLAEGQSRGNSGLYLQSRYECQVLDSFGTERMFNGLGALYRQKTPDINMAFPPLTWQTYDVQFTAPRWSADGKKIRNAHITSWVNGVKVQDNFALPSKTGAGKAEEPTLLPTHFQDHGDPVRFQNIWVIDRGLIHVDFPILSTKAQQKAAAAVGWEDQKAEKAPEPKETPQNETDKKPDAVKKTDAKADAPVKADSSAEPKEAAKASDATKAKDAPKADKAKPAAKADAKQEAKSDAKPDAKADDKKTGDEKQESKD